MKEKRRLALEFSVEILKNKTMEQCLQNSRWKLLSTQYAIDRAVLECQTEKFGVYHVSRGKLLNILEQSELCFVQISPAMKFQMTCFIEAKFERPVSKKLFVRNDEGSKKDSGSGNEEAEIRQEGHFRGKINRMSQSHHCSKAS